MDFVPEDCFFDVFLPETGNKFDTIIVKYLRLSMRLVNNMGWPRMEIMKPKYVPKTLLILIGHQVKFISCWHLWLIMIPIEKLWKLTPSIICEMREILPILVIMKLISCYILLI
jgi:hypothetical protein